MKSLFNKPKNIFVISTLFVLILIILLDIHFGIYQPDAYIQTFILNNIFFAEVVGLIITTIKVASIPTFRKQLKTWIAACVVVLGFIALSLVNYHASYHFNTESDGRQSISYACIEGEVYATNNNQDFICLLRNIPLSNSDALMKLKLGTFKSGYEISPQLVESFVVSQIVLMFGLRLGKKINKT